MTSRRGKRRNFGGRTASSPPTLNLGRCHVCGTFNPSVPGNGLEVKCSGCGGDLSRASQPAPASVFTPPNLKNGLIQ